MEQFISSSPTVAEFLSPLPSLPPSPQPGPSHRGQSTVQPPSSHSVVHQTSVPSPSPPQATMSAEISRQPRPSPSPSPPQAASPGVSISRPCTPLPAPSPPQAPAHAAGPSRRHTSRAETAAVPQMVDIQQGILSEIRNLRSSVDRLTDSVDRLGDHMESNTRVSSHTENMCTMLEVIANSLADIAAKQD